MSINLAILLSRGDSILLESFKTQGLIGMTNFRHVVPKNIMDEEQLQTTLPLEWLLSSRIWYATNSSERALKSEGDIKGSSALNLRGERNNI